MKKEQSVKHVAKCVKGPQRKKRKRKKTSAIVITLQTYKHTHTKAWACIHAMHIQRTHNTDDLLENSSPPFKED